MKDDHGVRPVGIGETLRMIIGKCIVRVVGEDVQIAAGSLQTCTGIESGIEAAIHAVSTTFGNDRCEAVMSVNADNAFNRSNRKVALHNIKRSCPQIYQYMCNSYKEPARLHLGDGTFILSKEGVTQGDNLAIPMYSLSSRKLIESLRQEAQEVMQVWFADDCTGAGLLGGWQHLYTSQSRPKRSSS